MSAEGINPFQGGRPSEPPNGPVPGSPNYLGPGITPPQQGEKKSGDKRFCSNCGKEWPIETKFCTACGTWMQGEQEGKKTYKDHIAEQLQTRQETGEIMPTFVQQGPPKKEKKGRSPLVNAIIVFLCLILIVGGITYTFFQADAFVLVGKFMTWRGKYSSAAAWFNSARRTNQGDRIYKWATADMSNASMKLYGEYLDAMKYKDWTAEVEVKGGPHKKWKIFSSAEGNQRIEMYGQVRDKEEVVRVVIDSDGKRHIYDAAKQPVTTDLNDNEKKSRRKADKEKVIAGLKDVASMWYIEEKTEKINGKTCYILTVRLKGDKRGDFISLAGLNSEYPRANESNVFRFYIGQDDKLLHRLGIMSEGGPNPDEPLVSFTFDNLKVGSSIPSSAFGVGKDFQRNVE